MPAWGPVARLKIMRRVALLAALLASQTVYAEERYITVGADAVATLASASSIDRVDIRATTDEVAVIAVDDSDLEDVAHAIHEAHDRCGGFMIHDSLADAHASGWPAYVSPPGKNRSRIASMISPRAIIAPSGT